MLWQLVLALLLSFVPRHALGWGVVGPFLSICSSSPVFPLICCELLAMEGHEVIATIAEVHLFPSTKQAVKRILPDSARGHRANLSRCTPYSLVLDIAHDAQSFTHCRLGRPDTLRQQARCSTSFRFVFPRED